MSEFCLMAGDSSDYIALRGLEVTTLISGLLAETRLIQKYQNDTTRNLELVYSFPLPVGVTLLSFTVSLGERKYQGEVIPRAQAEKEYEEAIAKGNSAFRLQEVQKGIYSATLGNVMPGEAIEIGVNYVETLSWNGNGLRYRLPTTIAPRYGEPKHMLPWQRPVSSLVAEYPLALSVTITGELAGCAIECPSHRVRYLPEAGDLKIVLAKGATMDRDFVLEIECEAISSLGVVASARDSHVAMLSLLPPAVERQGPGRDVVIILDCSGSMQGDSIKLAKEGVLMALGSLQPEERFGLIAFGNSAISFDKQLQPANRKNLEMARRWINCLDDMGGTQLYSAMNKALDLHDGSAMDILLLTDGEIWLDEDTERATRKKGIRIFTIGIGSAVAQDVVQKLADDTGGACELVSPNEDMSARIYRHFNRMRQPEMSSLVIDWPMPPKWQARPERACFAGDAYVVFAGFDERPAGQVYVRFAFEGVAPASLDVPLMHESRAADAIVRAAARQHLPRVPMVNRQTWAVRYQLLTEQTDYLVSIERAEGEKAENLPALHIQPQMLAAGWGGSSSVVAKASAKRSDRMRFSVGQPSIDYHSLGDIPAVVRKRTVVYDDFDLLDDNGYERFIKQITTASRKKIFAGLPTRVTDLRRLALPEPLETILDELLAAGYGDEQVVRAFYRAFLEHDGSVDVDEKFLKKMQSIVGDQSPDSSLVSRILALLNSLFQNRSQTGVSLMDVPPFLRRQAD